VIQDEVTTFLNTACIAKDEDPIKFWKGQAVACPNGMLWRMTLDYLSIPATSCDVERAFSRGLLTVTHRHHSLLDTSTQASIVVGDWLKDGAIVDEGDLADFFDKKNLCPKKGVAVVDVNNDADVEIVDVEGVCVGLGASGLVERGPLS
jgi:hypothetical protein